MFRRIFLATDFSPVSEAARREAVRLAIESGAELVIGHVCKEPNSLALGYSLPEAFYEWDTALRQAAEKKLRDLVDSARREGANARMLLLRGFPDEVLGEAAEQEKADLLVMGTHGRTGAARFFIGSTAAHLVASAPCPVMTVRVPVAARAGERNAESPQAQREPVPATSR